MLVKPSLEQLLPKVESRYTLAMLVARRTRQLVEGAEPMAVADSPNLVTLACEEVFHDKVACVSGLHNPIVPLRPEIEEARRLAREMAANQAAMEIFPEIAEKIKDGEIQDSIESTEDVLILEEVVIEDAESEIIDESVAPEQDSEISDSEEDVTTEE